MRPSDFMQRNPVRLDVSRSKFDMHPRWTGTFNAFQLCPIFTYTDVLPGDTFKLSTSFVVRMSTPIAPVMDDLWLDVAYYFVPHELILSRSYMSPSTNDSNHSWKAFIGAQDSLLNMPIPDSDVTLPHMEIVNGTYRTGGIADCMGIPNSYTANSNYWINCLAPLAFMAVWNENYREPNTENPGVFSISSNACSLVWPAVGSSTASTDFGKCALPHVCRFHGFFGSALPWPQRNSETVLLPLGTTADVIAGDSVHSTVNNISFGSAGYDAGESGKTSYVGLSFDAFASDATAYAATSPGASNAGNINRTNLVADLANASAVSINVFRLAVQEQRWYEALARGGNRIDELTAALFGVMPKDAGGNQPEYLGGKRIPLQVSQVNVTANGADGNNSKVGQTGAFSLTSDSDYYFTKSFDKWGSIIGVCCVRYRDSFGGSINPQFLRHERFDWYFPQFANLGEMPLKKHLLSIDQNTAGNGAYPDSAVFGYQEAWADFRTIPDIVTGLVRPGKSLQQWTYANTATASSDSTMSTNLAGFLQGTNAYKAIDRTLETKSETSGFQFFGQFEFSITAVRPMPMYSIPGLVDHH